MPAICKNVTASDWTIMANSNATTVMNGTIQLTNDTLFEKGGLYFNTQINTYFDWNISFTCSATTNLPVIADGMAIILSANTPQLASEGGTI